MTKPLLISLALLASCSHELPPLPQDDTCGAAAFESLIGQNTSALEGIDLPPMARVIGPNTAITKDLRLERVNIDHDARGTITRIWCG